MEAIIQAAVKHNVCIIPFGGTVCRWYVVYVHVYGMYMYVCMLYVPHSCVVCTEAFLW